MNEEQFDAWLARASEEERAWRVQSEKADPDLLTDDILAEYVIQEVLRDAIFDKVEVLHYCARVVLRAHPEMQEDYDNLMGADQSPSDEFFDLHAKEIAARLNEVSKDLSWRKPKGDDI